MNNHSADNQYIFLATAGMRLPTGRILEIGTKDRRPVQYKKHFSGHEVIGLDVEPGNNVDVVCNMEGDCVALGGEQFAGILCCSVLEHTPRPWLVAENIENHLMRDGLLYVSVPWVHRHHPYPDDYWRISASGVRSLFHGIKWSREAYTTNRLGEFITTENRHDKEMAVFDGGSERLYVANQHVLMLGARK